jgi:ligand-binding sensor domain-containing protein
MIQAVYKDEHSNDIWVGTLKGLNRIISVNSESGTGKVDVKQYKVSKEQNGNKVGKLFVDAEGNVWLGTQNGLYRFRDPSFATYSEEDGLKTPFIYPIFRDRKNLWVGTLDQGFFKYDGKQFQNFTEKEGLLGTQMNAGIEDREGNIWMGTNKGLSIFDGNKFKNVSGILDGLKSDSVTALLQDRKGRIWLGGNKGGTVWNGKKFKTFELKSGASNFDVWYLFEDSKGNLSGRAISI